MAWSGMMYILCGSGTLRLGRYLRNAGSREWIFECQEYDRRAVEEWTKIYEDCLKEGSGRVDTYT